LSQPHAYPSETNRLIKFAFIQRPACFIRNVACAVALAACGQGIDELTDEPEHASDSDEGDDISLDTIDPDAPASDDVIEKAYGVTNAGVYSAVELLLTYSGGAQALCSGVLLNNYVLLTAAHCLQPTGAAPAGNVSLNTRITYYAPGAAPSAGGGPGSFTVTKKVFYYQDPGYPSGGVGNDIAVGALGASLGLTNKHFSTLYRQASSVAVNTPLALAGYGELTQGLPGSLNVSVTNTLANVGITWKSTQGSKGACDGDSGSALLKDLSTPHPYIDAGTGAKYWRTVPVIAKSVSAIDPLPGTPAGVTCNNNGTASDVISKYSWIKEIVEFWPVSGTHTCKQSTNGDKFAWCWATP
jgi:V8-like Glu-specific endopeptidase